MNTVIIGDDPGSIQTAAACAAPSATILTDRSSPALFSGLRKKLLSLNNQQAAELGGSSQGNTPLTFMLCFRKAADQVKARDIIDKAGFSHAAFLAVQHEPVSDTDPYASDLIRISTSDLVGAQVRSSVKKLKNMQRLERLREVSRSAEQILILMQHDPDPDALASGLALRNLLDRNRQTSPLATFGEVTRRENINMIRILDMQVLSITPDMLDKFSCIAMVDVQPPYFLDHPVHADIVFDHHPHTQPYTASFTDIRPSYGATSTILGQYLLDAGISIPQRLATALVYGIKTDTMSLERDITRADLEVFTSLYPQANLSMIRQIESASLDLHEIKVFIKALKNLTMLDRMACTWLGHIKNDAMIPRLADFSLQVAGAEWSFAAGIADRMVVCSARNVGYVKHAGDLMRRLFGDIGSAGGHRSTAKAVIPLAQFKKRYKVTTSAAIATALFSALKEANS